MATLVYDIFKANAYTGTTVNYPALGLVWGSEKRRITSGSFADAVFYAGVESMHSPTRLGTGLAEQTWTNPHPKGASYRYVLFAPDSAVNIATATARTSTSLTIQVADRATGAAVNATHMFVIYL